MGYMVRALWDFSSRSGLGPKIDMRKKKRFLWSLLQFFFAAVLLLVFRWIAMSNNNHPLSASHVEELMRLRFGEPCRGVDDIMVVHDGPATQAFCYFVS